MPNENEVRDFLMSRRARITPESVGLPGGPGRRVAGLRRGEVAVLAGVSTEYYARIERGNLAGVTDSVLDAIASTLRFDDSERSHLFDLARSANASPVRRARPTAAGTLRPGLRSALEAMTDGVAFVQNARLDVVAMNTLGRALYSDVLDTGGDRPNFARFAFLHQDLSRRLYPDWEGAADTAVAMLRTSAGRHPDDRALRELVGELATLSPEFRRKWAAHEVRLHTHGVKVFHHHAVGDLRLSFENLTPGLDDEHSLLLYSAEPGSDDAASLRLLASWAATREAVRRDVP
ncbi:helix-turn-helix transcriptional regulator [Curtobacterium sp. MCBD17_021]|uniref:helix-turn-helix transcriptional regulator n=1 Tax=Curtobacterium sp. MCBD17_021 TaxID=2175665 RepID=UPI000DA74ED7|nr:helix-turn-helix transcriptional regulator [Curtobacterium sp. MCBD17_021]PZE68747.1 transcriptional regulator [Curtobacterium sp. MCBD17_021]